MQAEASAAEAGVRRLEAEAEAGGWRLEAEVWRRLALRPGWRLMSEAEAEAGVGRQAPGVDVDDGAAWSVGEAGGRRLMAWRRHTGVGWRCHTGVKAWRPGVRRQST
jgi:hypothetical protein